MTLARCRVHQCWTPAQRVSRAGANIVGPRAILLVAMGARLVPIQELLSKAALRRLGGLELLDAWLGANGLTRTALAERLDVTRSTLSGVLAGRRTSAPTLAKIAELSGIPLRKLEEACGGEP